MHLILDTSLHFFRLHSSLTMMRVTCLNELFQFEKFEFHGFKYYLYALKPSNFKDLYSELRLVHLISSLDISGWHVQNWTPCISSKVCSTHSLNISTGDTPSFWPLNSKGLELSSILQLIPNIQCVSKFEWFYIQNTSKKITFHRLHSFHHYLSRQHLLPKLLLVFYTCISDLAHPHISPLVSSQE